jgi:hypothetical protein
MILQLSWACKAKNQTSQKTPFLFIRGSEIRITALSNRRELKRMEDSSTIDKSQLQSIIDSEEERGERGR